jgi:hypothetical protein
MERGDGKFPGIYRAAREIAYDNGGIHRDRSEQQQFEEYEVWLAKQDPLKLGLIDSWLMSLTDFQLNVVCTDGEGEGALILKTAPAGTDELLNDYFDEVC